MVLSAARGYFRASLTSGCICLIILVTTSAEAALSTLSASPNSVTLSWTAVGDDGTDGIASVYDVRYATFNITDSSWDSALQVSDEPVPQPAGSAESYIVNDLAPATTYYLAIRVCDEANNWSTLSNVVTCTTDALNLPPSSIADLNGTNSTTTSLILSWTAPGQDADSGTASQYDIRYSTSLLTEGNWDSAVLVTGEPAPQPAGSNETFEVTGLVSSTEYFFGVKTADEGPNWSALSNVAVDTTAAEASPPAAIANLGAGNETATSIDLSWTAPGDDGNAGTASQYDIRYAVWPISDATWDSAVQVSDEPAPNSAGTLETFRVNGLTSGIAYFFALKTADEVPNWSALSNVVMRATSGDQTPPASIDDLQAETGAGEGEMLIGWSAPGDDHDLGTATGYMVKYSTGAITESNWDAAMLFPAFPQPVPAGGEQSLVLAGLTPGQLFYVAVKAFDDAANLAGISNTVSAIAGFDLTVDVDDEIAALLSPLPGDVVPSARPILTVENISSGTVDDYYFEVATDSGFVNLAAAATVVEQTGPTTSWKVNSRLDAVHTYYWRVRTALSEYSEIASFTVSPVTHAFPNPFVMSENDVVTFADLSPGADVVLMSVSGRIIRQWSGIETDEIIWDGTNASGEKVASGLYLWYASDSGPDGKLMVLR